MATLRVLSFDAEGRPIEFEPWLDDLHLFLISDSKDNVSLFDHTSGASVALAAAAELSVRSQWQTRDAAARLAIRNHLPLAELKHFGEHKTAKALYDAVVARYSSPATAELSRLMLPYLFPELSTFPTVADLITHLRTSDTRLRAALPKEFCAKNPPPMYWTLHFIVTRLPDSLSSVRDHFLARCPTELTVDLLEEQLLAAEKIIVAVAAARGALPLPSPPPSLLLLLLTSLVLSLLVLLLLLVGGAATARAREPRVVEVATGGMVVEEVEEEEVAEGLVVGVLAGVAVAAEAVEAEGVAAAVAAAVASGAVVAATVAVRVEALALARASSSSSVPRHPSSFTCNKFHTQYRCFSRLDDAWREEMGEELDRPRWHELYRAGVDIFALDFDAIISAITALTPLPAPVPVRLADPSGGPVLARSSTVLPCTAVPSGLLLGLHLPSFLTNLVSNAALQDVGVNTFTPAWQRVAICTCAQTGRHLATFNRRPGSNLYTLTTASPQVAAAGQVSASVPVASPCECRSLSHQTLLWHHRLGHPSLPRLRGMHHRLLVSGLPRSLPPLPASPAPPCLPCVEGRQRAAPHSSSFPPTEAPLQTLHLDVWGPARVTGQGGERYFLLVVDDYSRYTTVFPLRTKGEVPAVLIPWIRAVCLQLRRRFRSYLPVLRLHSDRGGEFSSDMLFTLPGSPQQNGVAERRIGLVMEIARTSFIHAAAPHFLWPFAVRYAAQQLNLWPRVSLPDTSPTLRWTGEVGDASRFRVWGARALVRDTVFASQDVTFDESVPFYRLFPYRTAPLPPPPLFLAPADASGPTEGGDVAADAPADPVPVDSGAAGGGATRGAVSEGAEPMREVLGGVEPRGAGPSSAEPEGAELEGAGSGGAESAGVPQGLVSRRGPLSPQGAETGAVGAARSGGAVSASVSGYGGARTGAARAARIEGAAVGGAGAGDPGAGAVDPGVGDPGAGGAGATGAADAGDAGAAAAGGAGAAGAAGGAGAAGAGGEGAASSGGTATAGAGGAAGTGGAGCPSATDHGGARTSGAGAAGTSSAADPGAGGTAQSRLFFAPPSPSSLPPPDTVLRQPASRLASPVRTIRTARRVPGPRPPPVPGVHTMALRPSSVPLRVPLPSPPASSLPDVPDPESDLVRAAHPTVTRLLATVVTDPSFESAAASALVAELVDFAAACRLDYAAGLVAESESVCPPSVGGECALGTDVLEDRQEDFDCLAVAAPHLVAMLLAHEGDPDALDIPTPRSYAEAILGTYVDEVPPPGANIVDGMWIFRVKRPPGSPPVFKARYVARGFSQRQGVDFFQTFSPTPKMTTLRVLLHVAAQRDYELHSLDFSTAFLQGSLHEEIWLRRPPGFTGAFPPGTQWSLRRPVYGLCQAPREWHDTLRTTLAALGFAPSTADLSLFLRTDTSLPPFYILVYVDDLVFSTVDTEALTFVKSELKKRHTCTDLGELRSYLGLQITRDRARRTITLTQSHMVQQVLQRFGFQFSSPQSTPLATGHSLSALPSDESVEPSGPYPELVGCLMYLMTCTRPDLAYPLGLLARYVAPGRHRKVHWDAAKRVLRYLCSTSGMGLVLGGRGDVVLTGHSDASWVDDLATQRSSQGYTFSLGSGSVSWRSTRSSSVLSSSCEAEIYATAMAAQELRWLTYRSAYVDNKAAIALCEEHRLEHRTKHIALRYFLARELQQRHQLRLTHVDTRANTADIFTKALPSSDHQRLCTLLGLVSVFS
ncbi:unnamed protein product [Closterium sp. Yama58-4]|nr:unnamed protein product [Closterium sp. Yama58-4]